MNRLQKKCILGTTGLHLLLFGFIVIAGSGFFERKPKPDNTPVLEFIPANLIDADAVSGVKNATPPPPAPARPNPPQPPPAAQRQPTPPPTPKVTTPVPAPSLLDKFKDMFKPEPAKATPKPEEPHQVKPNLQKITRKSPTPTPNPALQNAIKNLKTKLNKGTVVNLPGNSSVAYASYAAVVRTVYDQAWVLPDSIAKDENITVKVTIASDGTVLSSSIVTPSGDAPADASVQKALDRVQSIAPFPEGSTEKERTYTIVFNPQVKSNE